MEVANWVVLIIQASSSALYNIKIIQSLLNGINMWLDMDPSSLEVALNNNWGYAMEIFLYIEKRKASTNNEMNNLNDTCNKLISQIKMCGISISVLLGRCW